MGRRGAHGGWSPEAIVGISWRDQINAHRPAAQTQGSGERNARAHRARGTQNGAVAVKFGDGFVAVFCPSSQTVFATWVCRVSTFRQLRSRPEQRFHDARARNRTRDTQISVAWQRTQVSGAATKPVLVNGRSACYHWALWRLS